MFLGRYYSYVTQKGRVALPSKFRNLTGREIVITRWYEKCLVIVGRENWNGFFERLLKRDSVPTRPVRSTERFIFSTAYEVDLDDQGRFVLPVFLRELIGLKEGSEVVFLGLGDRIELWDRKVWEEEEDLVKKEADKMLEEISKK